MRWTIGTKIALGFLVVLLVLGIYGVVVVMQIGRIDQDLTGITQVTEPISEATFEMEINLIGMGFGLLGYLNDHDPGHLDRIEADRNDFEEYQKVYEELTETQKGEELAAQVDQEFDKFSAKADELIVIENNQTQKMGELLGKLEQIDVVLDDQIQISIDASDPQAYQKMQAAMEMEINTNGIAKGLGSFLMTGLSQYEERVQKDTGDFLQALSLYEGLSLSAEEEGYAREIGVLFDDGVELTQEIIGLDRQVVAGLAEFVVIRRGLDDLMDDEIQIQTRQDFIAAENSIQERVGTTRTISLVLCLVGIAIGTGVAIVITRGITKPVRKLVDAAGVIAKGDLTPEIKTTSKDEIGQLGRSFQQMATSLKDIVGRVLTTSESVSASSQQLSSGAQQSNASVQQVSSAIQQLAKGAQTQAQSIEETTRVMEQLNASVSQSAQSAQQAASASSQASQSAQKGAEMVKETGSTMDKISESTTATSEAVGKLGQRSEQMGGIVEAISSVADQTNLLALNAAIEAARAGEAGRGFAVVAEEVRKLAENSAKSASEIGQLIKQTTEETADAVKNMETSSKEVTSGKELMAMVGTALEEIVQASENVSTMLQQISAASQQMSSGAKQVVKSVEDVSTVAEEASTSTQQASASSQQMVATMQEMASSAQSLAEMGIELNSLVANFKIGEREEVTRPERRAPKSPLTASPLSRRLAQARKKMGTVRETESAEAEEGAKRQELRQE